MKPLVLFGVSAFVVVLLVLLISHEHKTKIISDSSSLFIYCAAGIKTPMEAIKTRYEKEFKTNVQIQYGGSGTLLSSAQISKVGDLFISADEEVMVKAFELGVVNDSISVAKLIPVVASKQNADIKIVSLDDLLKNDLRIGLANPEAASVGKVSKKIFEDRGIWEQIESKIKQKGTFKPTVNDLANDLKIGTIDIAIIWKTTLAEYPELKEIKVESLDEYSKSLQVGVLTNTKNSTKAFHFLRYMSSPEKGLQTFAQLGYNTIQGDPWSDEPRLTLYSGAMLRVAIDSLVSQFEKREGVRIDRVYNGCGILVSQMRSGEKPDAYFSCDISFMNSVEDQFKESKIISRNRLVMLCAKGNPLGIKSVDDLLTKGLRVGLGHPQKSALGDLTYKYLQNRGLLDKLQKSGNIKVESATGDFLVNQARTGSLDVVIVYKSNAAQILDHCTIIDLEGVDATATQPFAISKVTSYPKTMDRLMKTIQSVAFKNSFVKNGFIWVEEEQVGNK